MSSLQRETYNQMSEILPLYRHYRYVNPILVFPGSENFEESEGGKKKKQKKTNTTSKNKLKVEKY